jgi:hypothetical protein
MQSRWRCKTPDTRRVTELQIYIKLWDIKETFLASNGCRPSISCLLLSLVQISIEIHPQCPTVINLNHRQPYTYRLLQPPSATPLVNLAILISPMFLAGQRFDALDGDFLRPKTRVLKSDVSLPSLESKLFGLPRSSRRPESRLWRSFWRSGESCASRSLSCGGL